MSEDDILSPDALATFEYRTIHRRSVESPERGLMLAILENGIRVALGETAGIDRHNKAAQIRVAREWIFSDRESYLFDFRSICTALDIEPDRIRRLLRARIGDQRRGG